MDIGVKKSIKKWNNKAIYLILNTIMICLLVKCAYAANDNFNYNTNLPDNLRDIENATNLSFQSDSDFLPTTSQSKDINLDDIQSKAKIIIMGVIAIVAVMILINSGKINPLVIVFTILAFVLVYSVSNTALLGQDSIFKKYIFYDPWDEVTLDNFNYSNIDDIELTQITNNNNPYFNKNYINTSNLDENQFYSSFLIPTDLLSEAKSEKILYWDQNKISRKVIIIEFKNKDSATKIVRRLNQIKKINYRSRRLNELSKENINEIYFDLEYPNIFAFDENRFIVYVFGTGNSAKKIISKTSLITYNV